MRGLRTKKLRAIFKELVKRNVVPDSKSNFRYMKKLYMRGELHAMLPGL
jgi:hypothetical protein